MKRGRRSSSRRALHIVLAVSVALTLAADLLILTQRGRSTPVSLNEALDDYRDSASPAARAPSGATPGASPSVTATATATASGTVARSSPTSRPKAAAGFTRPAPGVYTYATAGYEQISIGDARHDYPEETFATVRIRSGCAWEIEYRLVAEHIDTLRYCSRPHAQSLTGHSSRIEFYGQGERVTYDCDPALVVATQSDVPGDRRTGRCTSDDGSRIEASLRVLGVETFSVGGVPRRAIHVIVDNTMSGRAQGEARSEIWYDARTGLPLMIKRDVETEGRAAFGSTHYSEHVTMRLKSLKPAT